LKAGDSFGELALISKKGLRNASIKADNDVYLGVISQEEYNKCFIKKEKQKREALIEYLRAIPFFSNLSRGAIQKIVLSLNHVTFSRNQVVTNENIGQFKDCHLKKGEQKEQFIEPEYIYFVLSGEFSAKQKIILPNNGKQKQDNEFDKNRAFLNSQFQTKFCDLIDKYN